MTYKGSCHCGNIQIEVNETLTQVMQCNCSICTKRGYLLWFVALDKCTLLTSEDNFATYQFNKKIINHNFCTNCGCSPFSTGSDDKGNEMAAVNVRCLDNVDISKLKINHYDGRSV